MKVEREGGREKEREGEREGGRKRGRERGRKKKRKRPGRAFLTDPVAVKKMKGCKEERHRERE